jgi:hypothetical protein
MECGLSSTLTTQGRDRPIDLTNFYHTRNVPERQLLVYKSYVIISGVTQLTEGSPKIRGAGYARTPYFRYLFANCVSPKFN